MNTIVFGRLKEGLRGITSDDAQDLIRFSQRKTWCGKAVVAIKLMLQLKGIITNTKVKAILQNYTKKNHAVIWTPTLEELFKTYKIGLQNLNPQELEKNEEKKELKDVKIEKQEEIRHENNDVVEVNPLQQIQAYQKVINETPQFNSYKISFPQGHRCEGLVVTGARIRPSTLFFENLFDKSGISFTRPDSGKLFAFNKPHGEIREFIQRKAENPDAYITVRERDPTRQMYIKVKGRRIDHVTPSEIYGDKEYKISYKEALDILESQKVYTSNLLPLPFYKELKKALKEDGKLVAPGEVEKVVLPGNDRNPVLLWEEKEKNSNLGQMLQKVEREPEKYGFKTKEDYQEILHMTLYQVGSMVVKTEDYRIFVDGNGKIIEREIGQQDAIRLINACGIRGFHSPHTPSIFNKKIMTETFRTALIAAEEGIVVFPAVGMGVWRGNPDVYWRSFLDAIIQSDKDFDLICVNPGHQRTEEGRYMGETGGEFQDILDEYKNHHINNDQILAKLQKISNLYHTKQDVVQLAHNFKKAFPDKIVSLFNASDPDVTLGDHVGEYTNNLEHANTTEENYTAIGTNGICFEGITRVHESPARLIQC